MPTQRKPKASAKVELAPNQVYIKRPGLANPVQTLVEGSTEWSYRLWLPTGNVSLCYQGRLVQTLTSIEGDVQRLLPYGKTDPSAHSMTLVEAVEKYKQHTDALTSIEHQDKLEGLEEWCVRQSFTPSKLAIKVQLPPDEYKRLERLVEFSGYPLETFMLEALYTRLGKEEEIYLWHEQWKQRELAVSTEHVELDQSHNS